MPIPMLLNAVETDNTFLGAVAENYVAQALRANGIDLRYWKNDNTAELEFVIQDGMSVIPVEVKKGTKVKTISMNTFVQEYKSPTAYRISYKMPLTSSGLDSNSQSLNPRADGFLVSTIEQTTLFPFQRRIAALQRGCTA